MVDIIIVTYNRANFLRDILKKLETQSIKDFFLIVTDDGSKSDGLIDPNQYPQIDRYLWAKKIGYTKVARLNEAIRMGKSEDIIILDDDCIPQTDDFIKGHVENLKNYPISRGMIQFPQDNFNDSSAWMSAANCAFKRSVMEKVGLFSDYLCGEYGHEDADFFEKLRANGYKRAAPIDPRTLTYHIGENYANNDRSFRIIGRNTQIFIEKWGYNPCTPRRWVDEG